MSDIRYINRKVLEALKSMGRMDGDMIDSAGEARTIEGWRQECERLRQEIEQLRIAGGQLQDERDKAEAERRHWYGISQKLLVTNNQLREQSESGAEAVSAGMIREIEALHIIIKHMAPLL